MRPKKKKNEKLVILQSRVSPELVKILKEASRRSGENVSTLIRTTLNRHFLTKDKQWII